MPTQQAKDVMGAVRHLDQYLVKLDAWIHDLRSLLSEIDWKELEKDYPSSNSSNVPPKPPDWP